MNNKVYDTIYYMLLESAEQEAGWKDYFYADIPPGVNPWDILNWNNIIRVWKENIHFSFENWLRGIPGEFEIKNLYFTRLRI